MPIRALSQTSFFSPEFVDPGCLEPGGLPWLLHRRHAVVFPSRLFEDWHGHGRRGRDAWPARVLMTALGLRAYEGIRSRRAMVRRLKTDISWRAAAGLELGGPTPGESTFRRFERYLRRRDRASGMPRDLLLHEHVVRLCLAEGLVGDGAVWAMDSTPMWCFGAVRGTVRMLGDGLRGLCKQWARAVGKPVAEVARQWDAPMVLAKSTKGHYRIDWRDPDARANVVEHIASAVLRVVGLVRENLPDARRNKHKGLLRRCRHLLRVVSSDLELDEDGRLVVARRVAKDRLVSITDPLARHSRKTKSRPFHGYRLHLLGDVVSGVVTAVSVTAANRGDAHPAGRLIGRAKQLCSQIEQVLGDTAYGGAGLHHEVRTQQGVDVLAPPPPIALREGRIPVTAFDLDVQAGHGTCPSGVTVELRTGIRGDRYFRWPVKACRTCPLRPQCYGKSDCSRIVRVHEHHEELVELRARWDEPETREAYRVRSQCERLVSRAVAHGGRQANAWGLRPANLQAHIVVMGCNLALLARALAAKGKRVLERAA